MKWVSPFNNYRPQSKGDNTFGSVCPSVRPSIHLSVRLSVRPSADALTSKRCDLWPWFLAWGSTLTLTRLGLKAKVIGQRSRSNGKNCVLMCHFDVLFFTIGSRSKVKVKVHAPGQGQSPRSTVWCVLVDIWARLAECSKNTMACRIQSKISVCLSVFGGCSRSRTLAQRSGAFNWWNEIIMC